MALFALEWCFPAERDARLFVRPRHRDFLERLRSESRLVAAGPWSDDSGALIILVAENLEEVERLLDVDPYVREGVGGARRLHEWRPIIGGTIDASGLASGSNSKTRGSG
jgi:uncharacterized protein YciI